MEAFSAKWFTAYYIALGILVLAAGMYFLLKSEHFKSYLIHHAETGQPPGAIRHVLKYFLLFTIPCFVLSFIPFSWIELLFSLWSLCLVYLVGIQLVRWEQTRSVLLQKSSRLKKYIQTVGVIMVVVSLVMFLLGYLALGNPD